MRKTLLLVVLISGCQSSNLRKNIPDSIGDYEKIEEQITEPENQVSVVPEITNPGQVDPSGIGGDLIASPPLVLPTLPIVYTADNCLINQDMNSANVDISNCPPIPNSPFEYNGIGLGAWELGQTNEGEKYKYGSLSSISSLPRVLTFSGGTTKVNEINLSCWAAGYYRLRHYLQNPPADYTKLTNAGFQKRFFQFQTDLRNGSTGYKKISSCEDHLIKWVTVIDSNGVCIEPTLSDFESYLSAEINKRSL